MFPTLLLSVAFAVGAEPESARDAFAPLNTIIGKWKGTGRTDGSRDPAFWSEKLAVEWRFKGNDAWLTLTFTDGKHFTAGTIHRGDKPGELLVTLTTPDKKEVTFTGKLSVGKVKEVLLIADREAGEEVHRFTLTVLHPNRFLYQVATKPKNATDFTRRFQVGTTKDGEPFADVAKGPECVVSGGRGTMAVTHDGKTYFVCCSGCRDEFQADPAKYIRLAKQKK